MTSVRRGTAVAGAWHAREIQHAVHVQLSNIDLVSHPPPFVKEGFQKRPIPKKGFGKKVSSCSNPKSPGLC